MKDLKKSKNRLLQTTLLVLVLGFIGLSALVFNFPASMIDLKISLKIQSSQSLTLDHVMGFISWFGTMPVSGIMIAVTALVFLLTGYRREALFILLTAFSGLISTVIKVLIDRPRPTKDLVRIVEIARQQSFPSGHTLFYTIFFGFIIIVMGNLKSVYYPVRLTIIVCAALMILLIPFSRIYLGAHWFTDVLGGAILGILCLSVLGYFYLPKKGEPEVVPEEPEIVKDIMKDI
jgi:membrane-associated phospholipid phosphatase